MKPGIPNRLPMILLLGLLAIFDCADSQPDRIIPISRQPRITPDYTGLMIPSNIAPMHFRIQEEGRAFRVTLQSSNQEPVVLHSSDPEIRIFRKTWRKLLRNSEGDSLRIQIDVLTADRRWARFQPVVNSISESPIDGFLVYRRLKPYHTLWGAMGIYQRNLESFSESPLILNRTMDDACINCHSFYQKRPDRMILHTRGRIGSGMLVADGGDVIKVDTRTAFNRGHATFRSWHPNGELLAVSINQFIQLFHSTGESREVCDLGSDLMVYHFKSQTLSTYPTIARPDRMETYPSWAPDGKTLYFSCAPKIESYLAAGDRGIDDIYRKIRYDLQAISYDPDSGTWGELTTLLPAAETGKSILQPNVSPDGRFLLFVMADYGGFPIFNKSSDIYLMDLQTGGYHKPDINSDETESSACWSSNGRWFVFVSKRMDGLYAFPYLCHVDENGRVSKPFLLPQEDPDYYDSVRETFNVPEFVTGPVQTLWQALSRAALDNGSMIRANLDEKVQVDQVTSASVQPMWQQP
jgi:hypothetical protein